VGAKPGCPQGEKQSKLVSELRLSELMTQTALFHQLRFRQSKRFYLCYACHYLRGKLPKLLSYNRCVEILPLCVAPLATLFNLLKGECGGIF